MRIKSYKTNRFAGLRDVDLEFKEGLNVILGSNESGKSTVVDGIHSTLFKGIKLRKNNNADINFSHRYMPRPSGDFIDGRVTIGVEDRDYEIYRGWGSKEDIHFRDNDGSIIKDEGDIEGVLSELLSYGESTYTNIVFAKQRDLKLALNNIIENSDVTDEISDLLRRTMMELEGVSIEGIEKDINDEIEALYKRWDRDKNYPQNNKGINNPYKSGKGEILDSFYKKETLLIEMEETERIEKAFEEICAQIQSLEKTLEPLKAQQESLEEIEDDVNSRQFIELKIESLDKQVKEWMDDFKNWPRIEEMIKGFDEKIKICQDEKKELIKEKENIKLLEMRDSLEKRIKSIGEANLSKEEISKRIEAISPIKKEDIDSLTELERDILTLQTTMKASKMLGELKSKGDAKIYISRDFGEREILDIDESFEANGVINITSGDFEIEIKTGDIDFKDLNDKHIKALKDQEELLKKLSISSLEEGKINLEKIASLLEDKKDKEKEISFILGEDTLEALEESFEKLKSIKVTRDAAEIERLLEENANNEKDISIDRKVESQRVEKWIKEYSDHDHLLDLIMEKKAALGAEQAKFEALKPLPEEFSNTEDFKIALTGIREDLKTNSHELELLRPQYYEVKGEMKDLSFEEVEKEYKDAEKTFKNKIKRGEKLLEIDRVFKETKERLSNNPMGKLVDEFARLLELITDGDYKQGQIDEKFNIKLQNTNGEIPIDLLSAGTYDSVTLALRFALLKHIFDGEGGYVVLDDCLVDLDPKRKTQSVKLINDFAEDYQIIFTTCDPETAKMLGGHIIEM